MLFTEAALGPEINATLAGPLLRQLGDGRALRPEETGEGYEPQPEGDWTRGGRPPGSGSDWLPLPRRAIPDRGDPAHDRGRASSFLLGGVWPLFSFLLFCYPMDEFFRRASPDFQSSLSALANFMRLSLMKAAHAKPFGVPCRKSGFARFFRPMYANMGHPSQGFGPARFLWLIWRRFLVRCRSSS